MLGGGGNPAAWYDVGGERPAHDSTGRRRPSARIGQGNDYVGVAVATTDRARRRRVVAPDRDRLQLGGRLRARLPGQGLLFSWPLRLGAGERMSVRVGHLVSATRDRAAEEAATARSGA